MDKRSLLKTVKYSAFLPLAASLPLPRAYRLAQMWGRLEGRYYPEVKEKIVANAGSVLRPEEISHLDLGTEFFKVMSCDEVDAYAAFLHPWRRLRKWIRVKGQEGFLERVYGERGLILLTFHFGGGSLIFPYLRSRSMAAHYLSIPLPRVRALSGRVSYSFGRFRLWGITRAMQREVIFVGGSKEKIQSVLNRGGMVVAVFDVVPDLLQIKDWAEVCFWGRPARFSTGLLSTAAKAQAWILPFFGRVGEDHLRLLSFEAPLWVEREEEALASLVRLLEQYVRLYPGEWHHWPGLQDFYAPAD